jgi:hypothetical protein
MVQNRWVGDWIKCEQELQGGKNDRGSESGNGRNWRGAYGFNFPLYE